MSETQRLQLKERKQATLGKQRKLLPNEVVVEVISQLTDHILRPT